MGAIIEVRLDAILSRVTVQLCQSQLLTFPSGDESMKIAKTERPPLKTPRF